MTEPASEPKRRGAPPGKRKRTPKTIRVIPPSKSIVTRAGSVVYQPDKHPEKAYGMCILGLTNVRMAELFDIDVSVFEAWIREHPEFKDAVHRGRDGADEEIALSMRKMAIGYDYTTEHVVVEGTGRGESSAVIMKVKQHQPAQQKAAAYWLSKRKADVWGDKPQGTGTPAEVAKAAREAIAALDAVVDPEDD